MKKLAVLTLFLLTALFLMPSIQKNAIEVQAASSTAKKIYIDVSHNEIFSTSELITLRYEDEGEHELTLEQVEEGLYITPSSLPLYILTNAKYGFDITCGDTSNEYTSSLLQGDPKSLLGTPYFNCVYLSPSLEGEHPTFVDYGYKGKPTIYEDATAATQRIWFDVDTSSYPNQSMNIGYSYKEQYAYSPVKTYPNSYDGKVYQYVDIPYEVNAINLFFMDNQNIIHTFIEKPLTSYGLCYTIVDNELVQTSVSNADAGMLKYVCEAYLSFGKAPSNGVDPSTISNLFFTFFKNKSATTDDLKNMKLLDYTGAAYFGNGEYDATVPKSASYSVNEKWNGLCNNAGIDPKTGEKRNAFSWFSLDRNATIYILLGAIGVAVLLGAATYLIVKYRKTRDC